MEEEVYSLEKMGSRGDTDEGEVAGRGLDDSFLSHCLGEFPFGMDILARQLRALLCS